MPEGRRVYHSLSVKSPKTWNCRSIVPDERWTRLAASITCICLLGLLNARGQCFYTKVEDQGKIATIRPLGEAACKLNNGDILMNSNTGEINDLSNALL
jgi:hypothetical protein